MKNNFKKSNKAKSIIVGVALVLSFVMIIGLCLQVFGQGKAKPSEWFKHDTEQSETETPDENGGAVINEEIADSGISVYSAAIPFSNYEEYGVSPQADSAYRLTATITPSYAEGSVAWSVAFKNPNSTWASGKTVTNYVTVTPSSDNPLVATVECKKAFGEQIIVTVQSTSASSVKATCSVDYRKKITSSTLTAISGDDTSSNLVLSSTKTSIVEWKWLALTDEYSSPSDWNNFTNEFNDTYTDYTIDDSVSSRTITIAVSDSLKTELDKVFTSSSDKSYYAKSYTFELGKGKHTFGQASLVGSCEYFDGTSIFGFMFSISDSDGDCDYYNFYQYSKLCTALKNCSTDVVLTVTTTMTSGQKFTYTNNVNIADSSVTVLASSLALNSTNIVF